MRHNLNGSKTIDIYPETGTVPIEAKSARSSKRDRASKPEENSLKSEFVEVFTPGAPLMSVMIGEGRVSFTPLMIEGPVTIGEPPETSEPPEETDKASTDEYDPEQLAESPAPDAAKPPPPDSSPEPESAPMPSATPEAGESPDPEGTQANMPEAPPEAFLKSPESPEPSEASPIGKAPGSKERMGQIGKTLLEGLLGVQTAYAEEETAEEQEAIKETATETPIDEPAKATSIKASHGQSKIYRQSNRNRSIKGSGSGDIEKTSKTIQYDGLFDEVTDIRLSGSEGKVKEDIFIHQYLGGHVFAYDVRAEKLRLVQSGQQIDIIDENGEVVATVLSPFMTDSAGSESTDITVELSGSGSGYRLTYTPSDAWLADPARAYPVNFDPSLLQERTYSDNTYITDGYYTGPVQTQGSLVIGPYSYAFVRFNLPTAIRNLRGSVFIQEATFKARVDLVTGTGGGQVKFSSNGVYLSTSPPIYSDTSYITGDISRLFSDALKPSTNVYSIGFDMDLVNYTSETIIYAHGAGSAQTPNDYIRITYWEGMEKPNVSVETYGNGVNSGTGYVNLSWTADPSASGYVVLLHNGEEYEQVASGNNLTSYTTKGKNIWPTPLQISQGIYKLRLNGSGGEFAMLPTPVYNNSGKNIVQSNMHYYFLIVPYDKYGNTLDPAKYGWSAGVQLPDTLPPGQATDVVVTGGPQAGEHTVAWNGITDITPTGIVSTMDGGQIEYRIDGNPSDPAGWIQTGSGAASGSYAFDTSALSETTHVLYLRGKDGAGNYGAANSAVFNVDRTPPSTPNVTVTPNGWTAASTVVLGWTDLTDNDALSDTQVRVGEGSWISTGVTSDSHSGYQVNVSAQQGKTVLSVRGKDRGGNLGQPGTATAWIDHLPPTAGSVATSPAGWTNGNAVQLQWSDIVDPDSGLASIEWRLNGGTWISEPLSSAAAGSVSMDIGALADGEYPLQLRLTDAANNASTKDLTVKADHTDPDAEILLPQAGVIAGAIEVWGSVWDLSLDHWTLTATGGSGTSVVVAEGNTNRNAALLGRLNTSLFADNETVQLHLEAFDLAGNSSAVAGAYLVVNNSAQPVGSGEVDIQSPTHGQQIANNVEGLYGTNYAGTEATTYVYVDGKLLKAGNDGTFAIKPLYYPENSLHRVALISLDTGGNAYFSGGLGSYNLWTDTFADDARLDASSGLSFSANGAVGSGTLVSAPLSLGLPVYALRLDADFTGTASFEYDAGSGFLPIAPGDYIVLQDPAQSVRLRATSSGTLHSVRLLGVCEMNATVFVTGVSRPIRPLTILNAFANKAIVPLQTSPSGLSEIWQYVDGELVSQSGEILALQAPEGKSLPLSVLGKGLDGAMYGSNARTETLLREATQSAAGATVTRQVQASRPIQLLRVISDPANVPLSYSLDGTNYTAIAPDTHIPLGAPVSSLWIRADVTPGAPFAWHAEGTAIAGKDIQVRIMEPPEAVSLLDYSEINGADTTGWFMLTWEDHNTHDETLAYAQKAAIVRDAKVADNGFGEYYLDTPTFPVPEYEVYFERTYAGSGIIPAGDPRLVRISAPVKAVYQKMKAPPPEFEVYVQKQSAELDKLYKGEYTFMRDPMPPPVSDQLRDSLMGLNKLCTLGFEPINFNTGNFVLETGDLSLPDVLGVSLQVVRTYNSLSGQTDGPMGARWAFTYGQAITVYEDGSIGYMNGDGAIFRFTEQPDGTYTGNDSDFRRLLKSEDGAEYLLQHKDGSAQGFDAESGLLAWTESAQGGRVAIERDDFGAMTGIIAPSGARLDAKSDAMGHIVSITAPGGAKTSYAYDQDGLMTSVVDAAGYKTRYEYDAFGRMTAWYDVAGTRQVLNIYDEQGRVTRQTDAKGGQYTLAYFDDHTITTDAEGNTRTIYFDDQMRTVRDIDSAGGEIAYLYNEQGTIRGVIDARGRLTSYGYDGRGNRTRVILANGTTTVYAYDERNNLIR